MARKLCVAGILNISKCSLRTGTQPRTIYTHFTIVYNEFTHGHAALCASTGTKFVQMSRWHYYFDLHCLLAFYYHPVNPKQIQITIQSRSQDANRRDLKYLYVRMYVCKTIATLTLARILSLHWHAIRCGNACHKKKKLT